MVAGADVERKGAGEAEVAEVVAVAVVHVEAAHAAPGVVEVAETNR